MNFPNITYLDGVLKKIESLEVTIYVAYLEEFPSFKTKDRHIIYLFIYQYPLRGEFASHSKFDESMKKALINCKEIPKTLRSSFENWTGWSFQIQKTKMCSKNEYALFLFEQNEKLIYWLNEQKTKRHEEYSSLMRNHSYVDNLIYLRPEKNED
tara:strand:+ start:4789 stop:5250 length:462 start_codon:yes stop_codon:yes gene_type:complete